MKEQKNGHVLWVLRNIRRPPTSCACGPTHLRSRSRQRFIVWRLISTVLTVTLSQFLSRRAITQVY